MKGRKQNITSTGQQNLVTFYNPMVFISPVHLWYIIDDNLCGVFLRWFIRQRGVDDLLNIHQKAENCIVFKTHIVDAGMLSAVN